MTNDQMSWAIAAHLEPMPTTPGVDYVSDPDISPLRAWAYSRHFLPKGGWRPRNFLSNPECTVLLWEKLTDKYKILAVAMIEGRIARLLDGGKPTRVAIQRGTAEAYMIANNLLTESQEMAK